MAKPVIRFFEAMYNASFDLDGMFITSGTKNKAVAMDSSSFQGVTFEGRNFKYEDGRLDSGIVEKLTVRDENGEILQTAANFKIDVGQIAGSNMSDFTNALVTRVLFGGVKEIGTNADDILTGFNGKDVLIGRGGHDEIGGGAGKDILTGGAGSDEFTFTAGMGKDTITDFDADGGVGAQDFINGTFADATITQVGKDTLVDFGSGDKFLLLKVDAGHITADDFV